MAAKIRGVKPEFWSDEAVVELSRDARLLFIGMWNFACDNGHIDDKPKQLKMRIFPADDDTEINQWLEELVDAGRITRGDGVITIPKFSEHQKPHKRWWTTCDLPWCNHPDAATKAPVNGGGTPSEEPNNGGPTVGTQETTSGPTADGEGDGEGEGEGDGERSAPRRASRRLPRNWEPTTKHATYASEHNLALSLQAEKFRNHATAKDLRYSDWDAAFRNWLVKALEFGQTVAPVKDEGTPKHLIPICPTCGAPEIITHYDECPDQEWRPGA